MSYLDPQRWGDVDFAGNALDWTTRKNKLLYPGYEMLRLALVEKCEVTDTGVPAVLQTVRAADRIYESNWIASFHSTISSLIPKFVNHTDHDGNWNGVDEYPALWSEEDILEAIGDAIRHPATEHFSSLWSKQQYEILNRLRWTRKFTKCKLQEGVDLVLWSREGAYTIYPGATPWATVEANREAAWLADAWALQAHSGPVGPGNPQTSSIENVTRKLFDNVSGQKAASMFRATAEAVPNEALTEGQQSKVATVDWYAYSVSPGTVGYFDPLGTDCPGYPMFWLYDDLRTVFGEPNPVSIKVPEGLTDNPGAWGPDPPGGGGQTFQGYIATLGVFDGSTKTSFSVYKWDIPGGFKFLDK